MLNRAQRFATWGRCQELSFWGRSELWPALASAVIGFTAGPVISHSWGARGPNRNAVRTHRSDPRQRSPTKRLRAALTGGRPLHGLPQHGNPQQLLQSLSQRRGQCPQHLRGRRPKIHTTCSNLGVINSPLVVGQKLMPPPLDAAH
jgi:hypothetical protein